MKIEHKIIMISLLIISAFANSQNNNDKNKEYNNIAEALVNPEKVYRLNLSNQKVMISDDEWSRFINLEYLNLENYHLKEIPIGITYLKNLKVINLNGNDFRKLPLEFSNLTNLEELYLNNEKYIDLPKTLTVLSKLPKLTSLHLENDNLKKLPIEILELENLENLYLNHNKLEEIPKIKTLDHLKYLDLNDNKIDPNLLDMRNLNFGFKINF
jgi:Leucine-rich repeat (LRR) protein